MAFRIGLLLVPAAIFVACSDPSAGVPKASPAPSLSSVISGQSPAGTPSSTLPSCRLAVTWQTFNVSTREWTLTRAGFIQLPAGTLTEDPSGTAVASVSGQVFYDLAARKWLPVAREAISPNGSQYAFVDRATGLHVVTIRSGTDRVLLSDGGWGVVEFGSDAIYLEKVEPFNGEGGSESGPDQYRASGLYRESLTGGTPRQLMSTSVAYLTIVGGHAWGLVLESYAPPRRLIRIDLTTGATHTWYIAEAGIAQLAIDTSGNPVLALTTGTGVRLLKIEAKDRARTLYEGPEYPRPQGSFAVDAAGLWLSTTADEPFSSPPLFVAASGRVVQLPTVYPNSVSVAGGCH